jgi:dipeptidyl aminopeptidase/acylaminoacyl peptidase
MKKIALLLMLHAQVLLAQNKDVIAPGSNLIIEHIPDIPVSLTTDFQRYTEFRNADFSTWHPKQRQMIISTRFANVPQLHQVAMPMGTRKQLTFFSEPVSAATYEPLNGDYILFLKDVGGNEFAQIYRYDYHNGQVTLLTDGGRSQNGGFRWSQSGKQLAYTSTRRNGADRDVYLMDPRNPSTNKLLFELQGGGWSIDDWSKDDKYLLLTEYISINESHYWLGDIATGTKKELTDRKEKGVSNQDAAFSKDGRGIYFVTDRDNEFARLAYMDLATKKMSYLTSGISWNVVGFSLSKDGKSVAFVTNEGGESKFYVLNTATKQYKKVESLPTGVYSSVAFHNNSEDLAVTISSARSSADIFVYSVTTGKVQRWTESEIGGLVAHELVTPQLIKWKSFDEREISGFYYKTPPKFTGKRPVLINIHGGPESQFTPGYLGANNYYLNEMGVALIFPNVRGSSGYGKTFLSIDNGFKREESVKDIGALLDWIATQPELDASRVMIMGGSYGGYMTLATATHYNDRIRCAVDIVGISNFNTFLKNTESYRRDLRRIEYGDERDTAMAAFFERIAPLNNAEKIKKPLFIVQGTNDPRVPRTEAVQMAERVRKNGNVVWYLEAKDEGHGFRKKNNADYLRYATILFMKQYLLDGISTVASHQ